MFPAVFIIYSLPISLRFTARRLFESETIVIFREAFCHQNFTDNKKEKQEKPTVVL